MRQVGNKYRIPSFYQEDIRNDLIFREKRIHFVRWLVYGKKGVKETGVLRTDINAPLKRMRRRSAFGWFFMQKQKMKYYYKITSEYYFKRLYKRERRKRYRLTNWLGGFLHKLEGRLDLLVYRSNFTVNLENSRKYIGNGAIAVNFIVSKEKTRLLKFFDIISVEHQCWAKSYSQIKAGLALGRVKFKYLPYLHITYGSFKSILYKLVDPVHVFYPFKPKDKPIKIRLRGFMGRPYWKPVHLPSSSQFPLWHFIGRG